MDLHYDPATDILHIDWPELDRVEPGEVDQNFALIKDVINQYFIKRFLLDARKTSHLPDTELLREQMIKFFMQLSGTTLQKVARLGSSNLQRAAIAEIVKDVLTSDVTCANQQTFQFRDFENEDLATKWLLED